MYLRSLRELEVSKILIRLCSLVVLIRAEIITWFVLDESNWNLVRRLELVITDPLLKQMHACM